MHIMRENRESGFEVLYPTAKNIVLGGVAFASAAILTNQDPVEFAKFGASIGGVASFGDVIGQKVREYIPRQGGGLDKVDWASIALFGAAAYSCYQQMTPTTIATTVITMSNMFKVLTPAHQVQAGAIDGGPIVNNRQQEHAR